MRLSVPQRGFEAAAPLPGGEQGALELPITSSTGAGAFSLSADGGGLPAGQPLGPVQLCPVIQPGVPVGSPPDRIKLVVRLVQHRQTSFAEERLDDGSVRQVPIYDGGQVVATGEIELIQLPVQEAPLLAAALPPRRDEPLHGSLAVRSGEGWVSLDWTGSLWEAQVSTGDLLVLSSDFPRSGVSAALEPTGKPIEAMEAELVRWLEGDPDSRLGLVLWRRSELLVPLRSQGARFGPHEGAPGRWVQGEGWGIWLGQQGERIRVVIAQRKEPLDPEAEAVIEKILVREP